MNMRCLLYYQNFILVKQEVMIQEEKSAWDKIDEENLLQDNVMESNQRGKYIKCVIVNDYGK